MLRHILYEKPGDTGRGIRGGYDVRDGKSTSGGDDATRSSDASTSHTTSSYAHTTNSDNIPNTKDYAMRTNSDSRTSRR